MGRLFIIINIHEIINMLYEIYKAIAEDECNRLYFQQKVKA